MGTFTGRHENETTVRKVSAGFVTGDNGWTFAPPATTWESRSAAGLDRGSAEDQGCHADVLLSIAAGGES